MSAACQDCAVAGQCPPQRPGENAKTVNELRTELAASQARAREVESKFAENFVVTESEAKEIANERVKRTELEAELEKGQLAVRALKKVHAPPLAETKKTGKAAFGQRALTAGTRLDSGHATAGTRGLAAPGGQQNKVWPLWRAHSSSP